MGRLSASSSHARRQRHRKRERGWVYAVEQLVAHGAEALAAGEDPAAWVRTWVARLTRPLKHPGNFRYAWMLDRKHRKHLPASQKYPKMGA